jgi:predicted PurR-regulated permease PerM
MPYPRLFKLFSILSIIILLVVILVYAQDFLIPLVFAGTLSMLLLPIAKWLQRKGINKAISILISVLVLISFFGLVIFFISWQVSEVLSNSDQIEQQLTQKYQQLRQYIADNLGFSAQKQQQLIKEQQAASSGKLSATITGFIKGLGSILTDTILVLVYIFLMMYFRNRLKLFVLKLTPKEKQSEATDSISKAQQMVQQYLGGLTLMIVCLWVMYGIGFSIIGVKNAILFAIICGVLEIVPFVGNLTGTALTIIMSIVQGGDFNLVIGILITYAIVQFIQTYLLEPLVVGSQVNINPLFTIISLVAGEILWGIPGMVLAIPLLGIGKIICDHVPALQPIGFLVGEDEKNKVDYVKKIKSWFRKS